jgi:hypothetical protein
MEYSSGGYVVRPINGLDLEVADGELMVLVGPSGCGKTTALRMLAGLEEISDGEIRIGDRVVNDLTPKDRDIAMVFQSYALYPHMTVRQNMGFALKLAKTPQATIDEKVNEAARILDLPVVPFQVDRPDTVVVAYDLTSAAEDLQVQLRERARGQVLYEHATRWTDPPAVAADACGLLAQVAVAPWHERPRLGADMQPSTAPADERAVEVVAEEIADAGPDVDTGDGETPPDPDSALAAFATAVADQWMTGGTREAPKDTGPVRSSRFI